jgi:parvulin-like peptidyl-prolyl isomerase
MGIFAMPHTSSGHLTATGVAVHLRTLAIPKSKKTREFVDELRAKLVAGDEDFAAAAKKYSYDNASPNGGDRGWVKRGELPADLLDAAFALKAGEISAVIEGDSHYHILNTVEHRDGSLVPLEKVREQIVAKFIKEAPTKLIRESQAKRIKGWIEQARKEHAEAMKGA